MFENIQSSEGRKKIHESSFSLLISYSPGQWQNPEDRSVTKNRLDYWVELAKLLERGKFNALFLGKCEAILTSIAMS